MKKKKIVLIAAVFGIVAVLLVQAFISSVENRYKVGSEPVNVLVAKGYIPEGTLVTDYMVEVRRVPREYLSPGAVTSINQLMNEQGKFINATVVPIMEGEQITTTKLVQPGKQTGMSILIPEGYRAVSIEISDVSGVARLIKPGDHVDIIGTCELVIKHKPIAETFTLFQNVLVLAIDQQMMGTTVVPEKQQSESASEGMLSSGEDTGEKIPTATLALKPAEAQKITHLAKVGEIKLALRPIGEKTVFPLGATETSDLVK
ncbi:MAG: Flp pilus assembly protein CpaB [Elusimicrobia bacterium]|nr:Flp pilus assembly protein CpaB [Elusimicrobiota bacterium]